MVTLTLPEPLPGERIKIKAESDPVRIEGRVLPPEDLPEILSPGRSIEFEARVRNQGKLDEERWWELTGT